MLILKKTLVLLPALMVFLGASAAEAKGLEYPTEVPESEYAPFLAANPASGIIIIQSYKGYDFRWDEDRDGLFGKKLVVMDYVVADRSGLEPASEIITFEDPMVKTRDVEVLVFTGHDRKRYRKKDLRWHEWTEQHNGVVTLDGQVSLALIPGLKVGDRVRVKMEFELEGVFGLGVLQLGNENEPTRETIVEMRCPRDHSLIWGVQGPAEAQDLLNHRESGDGRWVVHRWSLAAGPDEILAECNDRYLSLRLTSHLEKVGQNGDTGLVVGSDWATVGAAYATAIDDRFEADETLTAFARNLVAGVEDTTEKIDLIYSEVQRRCRYLGLFEGPGGMIPVSATEVFQSGFGDCKGLATLLISLLRSVGIDAHPVLVLADESRTVNGDIPSLTQFNHFIAWADDGAGGLFLDGTVDHYAAGLVPVVDRMSPVLLLRPGKVELMEIPATACPPGKGALQIEGHLDGEGHLNFELSYETDGNLAQGWRQSLTKLSSEDRTTRVEGLLESSSLPMAVTMVRITGLEQRRAPVQIFAKARSKRPIPSSPSELFLPLSILASTPNSGEVPACGARVPLWSYPNHSDSWVLDLPPEFVLADPVDLERQAGGLIWSCRIWQEGKTLRLERAFRFDEKSASAEQVQVIDDLVEEIQSLGQGYVRLNKAESGSGG